MEHRLPHWRRTFAACLLLTAGAAIGLTAQEQPASTSKFKVLVLPLARTASARGDFGEDVANEMRKLMENMPRHEPIEKKEVSDALRKYQLKLEDMDCIKNMQLATQINAELAMCGRFSGTKGSYSVDSVKFISTKTQEAFEVKPITAPDAKVAAQQIFNEFQRAVNQIEVLAFCYQYLESQQWQQAITNCEEALKINPQSIRANTGKAFAIYHLAGSGDQTDQAKLQEALAIYRKVLEIEPLEQEALRTAGIIAARLGQQDESRKYFKSYLELNPGDASVRIAIASEQATAGDPEGALRVVEEGLKADSANADLLTYAAVYAAQAAYKAQEKGRENQASTDLVPEAKTLFENAANYYKRLFDAKNADVEPTVAQQYIQTLLLIERFPEAVE
ncbi:MAG TPA: hypothetical protein VK864_08605, partial [Longimicrobiales bacterium]|nr:hypothetical protein [Longimicrobiales bacterium]